MSDTDIVAHRRASRYNRPMAAKEPDQTTERGDSSGAQILTEVVTRLRRALRPASAPTTGGKSLPMARVEVLLALREHQPVRVGELAALLQLAANTMSGLVQALVETGLVTRGSDPTDRRVAVVELTEAGRGQLAEWERAHEQRIGDALGHLTATEQETIRTALPALDLLVEHLANPGLEAL